MELGPLIKPWIQVVRDQVPGLELFDAHTHLGQNDPDGFRQAPGQLLDALRFGDARGAFVFPMHEPDGYLEANDMVITAAANGDGLLVPFCRINPHEPGALAEAERALGAGAKGIKLHPRAENFTLDHPVARKLVALAHDRTLPVLIHAGRGIPALALRAGGRLEWAAGRFDRLRAGAADRQRRAAPGRGTGAGRARAPTARATRSRGRVLADRDYRLDARVGRRRRDAGPGPAGLRRAR